MTSPERFVNEIPQPGAIIALVIGLTQDPWPKNAAEKDAMFARLGLRNGKQFTRNSADNFAEHFNLEIEAEGAPVFATSTEMDGVLTSVHLQLRVAVASADPEATQCFEAIISRLTELYGEPTIPWHGQRFLRRIWNVDDIDIDVHYGNDNRSSLMIGVQDERIFAEVEAYARDN